MPGPLPALPFFPPVEHAGVDFFVPVTVGGTLVASFQGSSNGSTFAGAPPGNCPPDTVPTTPIVPVAVHTPLGPAERSPLTSIEPPLTVKSALIASTGPRKHRLHLPATPPLTTPRAMD